MTNIIKGTWKWNNIVTLPFSGDYNNGNTVYFTSNNNYYSNIYLYLGLESDHIAYIDASGNYTEVYSNGVWISEAYQVVEFGDLALDQSFGSQFREIFIANAKRLDWAAKPATVNQLKDVHTKLKQADEILGTADTPGHVQLADYDLQGLVGTPGWAAGIGHTHSDYASASHGHDTTTLTPDDINAAWEEHYHNASEITAGTLPITRGGTGATTKTGVLTNLGITATATELNYCDGVVSNIQTQLNEKAPLNNNTQVVAAGMIYQRDITLQATENSALHLYSESSHGDQYSRVTVGDSYIQLRKQEAINDEESSQIEMYDNQLDLSVRGLAETTDDYDSEIHSGISISSHSITIGDIGGIDNDPEYDPLSVDLDANRVRVNGSKVMTANDFRYNTTTGVLVINTTWED